MEEKDQAEEKERVEEKDQAEEKGRVKEKDQAEEKGRMKEKDQAEEKGRVEEKDQAEEQGRMKEKDQAEEKGRVEKAMEMLREFVLEMAHQAGQGEEYGEELWRGISGSRGLLRELAYFYDCGNFLCECKVAGHTLADVLVWQVDHFKLYMDRPEEMNRYRQQRLLLAAFDTMVKMERDPQPYLEKLRCETGQDILA